MCLPARPCFPLAPPCQVPAQERVENADGLPIECAPSLYGARRKSQCVRPLDPKHPLAKYSKLRSLCPSFTGSCLCALPSHTIPASLLKGPLSHPCHGRASPLTQVQAKSIAGWLAREEQRAHATSPPFGDRALFFALAPHKRSSQPGERRLQFFICPETMAGLFRILYDRQ